jgi:hypothetical protein
MDHVLPIRPPKGSSNFDLLWPIRQWLNHLPIQDARFAHFVCKWIPAQCPFERDIVIAGRKVAHIPPLCKLNPFFEEFVALRFRALCYLVDHCGENVSQYC